MAGAQIYTKDMEEAKAKLYEAIAQYKKRRLNHESNIIGRC